MGVQITVFHFCFPRISFMANPVIVSQEVSGCNIILSYFYIIFLHFVNIFGLCTYVNSLFIAVPPSPLATICIFVVK